MFFPYRCASNEDAAEVEMNRVTVRDKSIVAGPTGQLVLGIEGTLVLRGWRCILLDSDRAYFEICRAARHRLRRHRRAILEGNSRRSRDCQLTALLKVGQLAYE
jgi:hypothetical protein